MKRNVFSIAFASLILAAGSLSAQSNDFYDGAVDNAKKKITLKIETIDA